MKTNQEEALSFETTHFSDYLKFRIVIFITNVFEFSMVSFGDNEISMVIKVNSIFPPSINNKTHERLNNELNS